MKKFTNKWAKTLIVIIGVAFLLTRAGYLALHYLKSELKAKLSSCTLENKSFMTVLDFYQNNRVGFIPNDNFHQVEPDSLRNLYTRPYDIEPVFENGWGYSNGPPFVAGVIALMKSANPEITLNKIREILYFTSKGRNGFKVFDTEASV